MIKPAIGFLCLFLQALANSVIALTPFINVMIPQVTVASKQNRYIPYISSPIPAAAMPKQIAPTMLNTMDSTPFLLDGASPTGVACAEVVWLITTTC